jgi:uncharacterized protein (UPF0276 family)
MFDKGLLPQMATSTTYLDKEANPCVAIGATYEGRDTGLLERMLPLVDYIEVTLETIAEVNGSDISLSDEVMSELKNMGKAAQIIVHGVGLSIGSHEGWSPTYFRLLDAFLDQVDVAWHSEHLGYTRVDGEHLGIMLAMPKTEQALDMVCERVAAIQQRYGMPFLLENIVHVIPDSPGDYSDAAFLNALTDRTGCGLILDAYNLECDAHNHGFDIPSFLDELQATNIRELHVACGVEHNGFLLDVHSQLARGSTVELAQDVVRRSAGSAQVVVYEFMPEAVPGLGHDAIADQLRRLRAAFGN